MLQSMTGYGQAVGSADGYRIRVDVRSVNHRYAEVSVRLPREWTVLEDGIRKNVQRKIRRGRVEVHAAIERESASGRKAEVDWELAGQYMEAAKQLKERFRFEDELTLHDLIRLPDVIVLSEHDESEPERLREPVMSVLDDALEQLLQMRRNEGLHLFEDIMSRLDKLQRCHRLLKEKSADVEKQIRERLQGRIREMLEEVAAWDEHRFQMETALLAERANVDEELTRLESHFRQFRQLLHEEEPVGRKLDFLIQEMNREINTIGSKSTQTDLVAEVIDMKAELEKIREQIQNIQ